MIKINPRLVSFTHFIFLDEFPREFHETIRKISAWDPKLMFDVWEGSYSYPVDFSALKDSSTDEALNWVGHPAENWPEDLVPLSPTNYTPNPGWSETFKNPYETDFEDYVTWLRVLRFIKKNVPITFIKANTIAIRIFPEIPLT